MPGRVLWRALCGLACALAAAASASAQPATHARYGGVLIFGQANGAPNGLDPTLASTGASTEILNTICEGMYMTSKKLNVVPQLATSMPSVSPDKLTYTIQLRHGIVFNDGTPFNAQAVVTTYQRDISLPGSFLASSLAYVDTVTATGPYTVVFHLKSRFSPLLLVLTYGIMSPTQLQKLGQNFGTDPVCVGPFTYDSQIPGVSVTVIKSPYYYGKYAVHLDKIVFTYFTSTAVAAAALEAGDIQAVDLLNAGDLPGVQASKGLALIQQPTIGYTAVTVNLGNANGVGHMPYAAVNRPLAQSPKLRQAFEEAIDRSAISKVVAPTVQPGCTMIAQSSPYYDPSVKCTPYDPADAKKLVASSGVSNPAIHLLVTNGTRPQLVAQVIQAEEQAIGINVVIDTADLPTVVSKVFAGDFDAVLLGNGFGVDPGLAMLNLVGTQGSGNFGGFSSPQLDLILANYMKATSAQSHKTLMHVAEEILGSARPVIIVYHAINFLGYNTSLTGMQADANGNWYRIAFAQYAS
jgi:peptide/nickel transport system substrate-binding protein